MAAVDADLGGAEGGLPEVLDEAEFGGSGTGAPSGGGATAVPLVGIQDFRRQLTILGEPERAAIVHCQRAGRALGAILPDCLLLLALSLGCHGWLALTHPPEQLA